jgi:hypothetical protein
MSARGPMIGMLLLAALGLCLGAASAQRSGWRITPGRCYGPICMGETKDDVRARVGSPPPDLNPVVPGVPDTIWTFSGFAVGFSDTDATVDFISIQDRTAVAGGGVRVGSTIDQVVDVYGDSSNGVKPGPSGQKSVPVCLETSVSTGSMWTLTFDYWDKGISFEFSVGASPRVREIDVFPPRACPRITYQSP